MQQGKARYFVLDSSCGDYCSECIILKWSFGGLVGSGYAGRLNEKDGIPSIEQSNVSD